MKHIVLVDNNLVDLKAAENMLKQYYKVSAMGLSRQVLEICKSHQVDLILLNVNMPDMDGFKMLEALKMERKIKDIPVMLFSDYDAKEVEVECFECGAVDFFTKPFVIERLIHRIEKHLQIFGHRKFLRRGKNNLEESIITSCCELIESRDNETSEHVERTKEYVRLIAKQLQRSSKYADKLDNRYIERLVHSSPLHDIGKIGIRDRILLKPGRLTESEYEQMKKHTLIGEALINTIIEKTEPKDSLYLAKEIAISHHERFDGEGYPWKLTGEEIPLSGRIVSVADVYDALISDRIYRKAMTHEEACELILGGKGNQFDPEIIEAFMAIEDAIYAVAYGYK
ncbi:HD domain-containing phosphohydrolase [Cellulosilyticum ruminicola]|uniref:HD domain-containing phosphohydrolase n=1 Tax=Cellulosilyticum ruminicola TaxID=425254 RepID=UPI0006D20AE6|nr:HD domain-containing phosphohydrolase [Cellulosilyticum ruminicola]